MLELSLVIQTLGVVAVSFLAWFVKQHIASRVEAEAKIYGELDARIARLNDLVSIETRTREAQADVELRYKHSIEAILQQYRVRLAFASKFVEKKIETYSKLLQMMYSLYRGLAKITGDPNDNLAHINKQDEFHVFCNENALHIGGPVRRAAAMLVAITTDVVAISSESGSVAKQIHDIRERARIVYDILRLEMAAELNAADFSVSLPTRELTDQWVNDSRDTAELIAELQKKSGLKVKTP